MFEKLKIALSLPEKELVDKGRRGKEWMQKDFSWENACEKTLETYQWIENKGKMPDYIYILEI